MATQRGFIHRRIDPDLPPGYDWETQIKKYCPTNLTTILVGSKSKKAHKHGYVFCHRGLYERAMKILENSHSAIENGILRSLMLHEVDARLGKPPAHRPTGFEGFLAHDEVANRVTAKAGRWTSFNMSEIKKTKLTMRRLHLEQGERGDFGGSFVETDEKVALLDDTLEPGSGVKNVSRYKFDVWGGDGRCLQLDMRGDDFLKALAFYNTPRVIDNNRIILKGYSSDYVSGQDLYRKAASNNRREGHFFLYGHPYGPHIIIVFYWQMLLTSALRFWRLNPDEVSLSARLKFDLQKVRDCLMEQVSSFIRLPGLWGPGEKISFTPEIVHSGLGLGYDEGAGTAVNPWNGEAITDDEVILESRIDRAMIDVSLELRRNYPDLRFSSCTRLCDVWTSAGELAVSIRTGKLYPRPDGEKGISGKLRSTHGGLYPQSDLVVADDPLAEIAARTWIDEYAQLDRRQLLTMSYDDWLGQAGPEVVAAVNKLNEPFLPNKWEGPPDEEESILEDILGADAVGEMALEKEQDVDSMYEDFEDDRSHKFDGDDDNDNDNYNDHDVGSNEGNEGENEDDDDDDDEDSLGTHTIFDPFMTKDASGTTFVTEEVMHQEFERPSRPLRSKQKPLKSVTLWSIDEEDDDK
jgi:hypothetical protein